MVIRIFYAVCALSVLFFAAFFIQCFRSASGKTRHIIRDLPISDMPDTARQFARWEKEMAEFMARQGRSIALLFLIAASSWPLLRANLRSEHSESTVAQVNRRSLDVLDQSIFRNQPRPEP